jgi:subtilase family serine protease
MRQLTASTLFRAAIASLLAFSSVAYGQTSARISQITETIDDAKRVELAGNTRPEALNEAYDRGPVDTSFALDHVFVLLKRPAAKEAALDAFLDTVNHVDAPNYHKWLTAKQLGSEYGPSAEDLAAVRAWLESHAITVNHVYETGMMIDISGDAGHFEDAFHPGLHRLDVDGVAHFANTRNPSIPAALAGLVAGPVSLNDFRPKAMHENLTRSHVDVRTHALTTAQPHQISPGGVSPNYTFTEDGYTYEAVTPGDLATIYRLFKLFNKGYSGQGQTIALIEDSDLYKVADYTTFRTTFGLSAYSGTLTTVHPGGTNTCTDPGIVAGTDGYVEFEIEYAAAAAPSASLVIASCKDSGATFGGLIALENMVNGATLYPIVSIGYGESEALNGATQNAAYYTTYQSAAAEGTSVFVASGDEGAAGSDAGKAHSTHGITVSGFASTPYNVAVGGTDFGDSYLGTNSTYWNTTNGGGYSSSNAYASALSYIPEIPWNDSCASVLVSTSSGYATTYGSAGFCNSSIGEEAFLTTTGGSGGPSNCATGTASTSGVASGTCAGYAKPSWQTVLGNPSDGVRDIPDVSLFAANGVFGHYYVVCYTDPAGGGVGCTGDPSTWGGSGGTSISTPIMAGMQALVNQYTGSNWGNPNPTYYQLAAAEYGSTGSTKCNSSNGPDGLTCTFNDVTLGDMDVNCTGTHNCYIPSGTNGVLSVSDTSYVPAYSTNVGWDFATGIGTVNAQQLVLRWGTVTH